jgi:small redox-active disulfide protein 2
MDIKVLGPGCAKCHQMEATIKEVIKDMGTDIKLEVVTDIIKIMEYPILTTPGLVINGKLVSSGRSLKKDEVIALINKNK